MTRVLPETLPAPFSFKELMAEISGRTPSPEVNFDPPTMATLSKPLAEMTVGVLVSCGVHTAEDAAFASTNDLSYRLVSRDTPLDELVLGHQAAIRHYALQDLNCAYPRDPLLDLETAGLFAKLAPYAVSLVGAISDQERLLTETVPQIHDEFRKQGVDLVLLLPFCPACHTSVPLIARALEKRGLATVMTSCLWERVHEYKAPRTVFLDFPMGCPAGRPGAPDQQRAVVAGALTGAFEVGDSWGVLELPVAWGTTGDGADDWRAEVRQLYADDAAGLASRADSLADKRTSLSGQETAFAIRCEC
jgi:D-proline reductase (dithiol) PrdB